jgi:hypothetical protein
MPIDTQAVHRDYVTFLFAVRIGDEIVPPRRCMAKTKAGQACKALAVDGADYCFAHEPGLAARRAEWRRAGGRKGSKSAILEQAAAVRAPEEVQELLGRTVAALQSGEITPQVANSVGFLCNLLLKTIREVDVVRRLDEIERITRARSS